MPEQFELNTTEREKLTAERDAAIGARGEAEERLRLMTAEREAIAAEFNSVSKSMLSLIATEAEARRLERAAKENANNLAARLKNAEDMERMAREEAGNWRRTANALRDELRFSEENRSDEAREHLRSMILEEIRKAAPALFMAPDRQEAELSRGNLMRKIFSINRKG